ncbi:SDR family oxidoreductase [Nonomuraea helvata]|uniref:SDR family oxidoreductase n=1 Tax=Nonomuraea helvata TaxID=37484 RepID=A0ABV5SCT1_9ACTN
MASIRSSTSTTGWTRPAARPRSRRGPKQAAFLEHVPTTRLGRPGDLAAVVAFLLSDDAEWINGQVWAIDGGANMRA